MIKRWSYQLLWLCSLPALLLTLPQAIYVKRTTIRLPEADGKRTNCLPNCNGQQALHMLHVGESTVAGVGVTSIEAGFTAHLARQLETSRNQVVHWHIHGVNGIRIQQLVQDFAANHGQNHHQYDFALVTMGVNDTTGLTSIRRWRQHLSELKHQLENHTRGPIFFTQVPPMFQFPALPMPLRLWMGIRSNLLDQELQRFCHKQPNVIHLKSTLLIGREMMAEDGYHPSALGYENWARLIVPTILAHLSSGSNIKFGSESSLIKG